MALTKVVGGVIADSTITSTDILDSTITNAKMALSPANASNLSSGSVPAAQLTLAPDPDLSSQSDDIALLAFKTQANGNLARYNLVDQSVDAFEDATGVDAGTSTNEYRDSSGKYYSGQESLAGQTNGYTASGTHTGFRTGTAEVLVVGGGGAGGGGQGGNYNGGAGGAGGLVYHATYSMVKDVVYDFTIGTGSNGTGSGVAPNGGSSVWNVNNEGSQSAMTANGGGGGGGNSGAANTGTIGSGGGAGNDSATNRAGGQADSAGGTGFSNQGGSGATYGGGGGGGAGAAGANATTGIGGNGGIGKEYTSFNAYGTTSPMWLHQEVTADTLLVEVVLEVMQYQIAVGGAGGGGNGQSNGGQGTNGLDGYWWWWRIKLSRTRNGWRLVL